MDKYIENIKEDLPHSILIIQWISPIELLKNS